MRIGIIDADLLYRKRHRFPNLACMKLSAYWKERGFETELLLDYSQAGEYDRLYVSKVFTDTFVPEHILTRETTIYGGTGFFYDKAPVLPEAVEHHTPDYHLYDQMVKEIQNKKIPEAPGTVKPGPKTGDDTNWFLPLLALGVSAGMVAGLLYYRKRHRK